ncbi:MAG: RsfA family transcriptional regulator [Bacillota bacterium]|nr:RsfA family transcriptional regulator [Bacillota bacterium]
MSPTRQDAWSQDEDLLLAEVVLRAIRDGGTQLQAFEEVGKQLSRTAAACGFRWNSFVRKQYKSGIELAKKQRKELKKYPIETNLDQSKEVEGSVGFTEQEKPVDGTLSFQAVIKFLQDLQNKAEVSNAVQENQEKSSEKIKELEKKTFYLAAENERLEKNLKAIEQDYRSLIQIMDRARKMMVFEEGPK